MKKKIWAGTYSEHGSEGIYELDWQDGRLNRPSLFTTVRSSKAIARDPLTGRFASTIERPQEGGIALIAADGAILSTLFFEASTPCFLTWKEGRIYAANYHDGTLSVLAAEGNVLKLVRRVQVREGAGCHQVLLSGDQILVPALFLDRLLVFDEEGVLTSSIRFENGTGPRHGVLTKDGGRLYLVAELSNELFVLAMPEGRILARASVLPEDEKHQRGTAEIRLSADEKTIYVSTRGRNLLSVLDADTLKLKQAVYSGGNGPWTFELIEDTLLCANRASDNLVLFPVLADGTLGEVRQVVEVPAAVSLAVSGVS